MDGIINVLKPPGMTSHDVVAYLRRLLQTKTIGHTGTLDPSVPGVLPVCMGKATRMAEFVTAGGKNYRVEITFGITTDSQDSFGKVVTQRPVDFSAQDALNVLPAFTGKIKQTPPMVSAVKVGGKKLYELARQGLEIERPAREVVIAQITPIEVNWQGDYPTIMFDVVCSKGTYMRTLCADWGDSLGCGAHMSFLLRTRSGPFDLADAWTLEEIAAAVTRGTSDFLQPPDRGADDLPRLVVAGHRVKALLNGLSLAAHDYYTADVTQDQAASWVRLYDQQGQFLALGLRDDAGAIKPKKVFVASSQIF